MSSASYSTDWFVRDENRSDCLKRFSGPQHAEAPVVKMIASSSSSTTLRESPTTPFHSGAFWTRKRRRVCCSCDDGLYGATPQEAPDCKQGTFHVVPKRLSVRKRTLDGHAAHPQPDTQSGLFSLKCMELQGYIQPLSSILRGLKSGRYSTRLSSSQESLAMDRIQRIMGVLQNANMGGHFLSIIMKIGKMLRSWFPHIKPKQANDSPPAKKQKIYACNHISWLHTWPVCSRRRSNATLGPHSSRQGVTQDNLVSSSTDWPRGPPRRFARASLPFKISSPCLERLLKKSKTKKSILTSRRDNREAGCHGYLHDMNT
ncbi:uncharacterized protein LOC144017552 [Festucalex cinctus]